MTDTTKIKKPRKPRTEEHKQKLREAAIKRNAAAELAKYRELAWTPEARERRDLNTKAAAFLSEELYPLLLKLDRATRDQRIFALLRDDPEMNAKINEWDGEVSVTFTRSARSIRDKYGAKAYSIWQKLFVCIQQGGKNKDGEGYPSIWSMNNAAIADYLAEHTVTQSKTGRAPTISEAVEMLMPHDSLRRVWVDWDVKIMKDKTGNEYIDVVGQGSKVITGVEQRKALRPVRKAVSAVAAEAKAALREAQSAEGV